MKIKVLIVCSGNTKGGEIFDLRHRHPFVYEQIESLKKYNVEFCYFFLKGKGITGYLKNYLNYIRFVKKYKPDLIHAHYGLSGLFANLQRKIPVITTFHGSDVFFFRYNRFLSCIAHFLSSGSIVVNGKMAKMLGRIIKTEIIPCGVDIGLFYPSYENDSTYLTALRGDKINILFSSRFDYYEKNYPLAKKVMATLGPDYNLIELKGYSREDVNLLLNKCDAALMTSISEGSPMFIKEAMACNCPIVSTNVGDVCDLMGNIEGQYVTGYDPDAIAAKIKLAVEFRRNNKHANGRERIIELGLDSESIALRIYDIYLKVLKGRV